MCLGWMWSIIMQCFCAMMSFNAAMFESNSAAKDCGDTMLVSSVESAELSGGPSLQG